MAEFIDRVEDIEISRTSRGVTRRGFASMLILVYHSLYADRVRSYSDLSELTADGFAPDHPAYVQAAAAWAQEPSLPLIKIGRRALPFTQVVDVTPNAPLSGSAAETWTLKVDGLTATFTSDATPTLAEVCTGVAAAVNALGDADAIVIAGASSASEQTLTGSGLDGAIGDDPMAAARFINFTFSNHANWDATTATLAGLGPAGEAQSESIAIPDGGNVTVTSTKRYTRVTSIVIPAQSGTSGTFTVGVRAPVTADGTSATKVVCMSAAGELHSYELVTANFAGMTTTTANPGVATDLAAVLTANADWFGLVLDSNGSAEVRAAAAWCETAKKFLGYTTSDQAHLSPGSVTALGYLMKSLGYLYSWGFWRAKIATPDACASAALLGKELPKTPGASHFGAKTLTGQYVDSLTDAQRQAIEGYNLNHYTYLGDVGVTFPGMVAAGEWMDVVRDLAALRTDLQADMADTQISNDKIPIDDDGLGLIAAKIRSRLQLATDGRILATNPKFTLTIPRPLDIPQSDRQVRTVTGITWEARLAGAVLKIKIRGRVAA